MNRNLANPIITALFLTCVCSLAPSCIAQGRSPEYARSLSAELQQQGRVMWIDATANIERIKSIDGVRDIVQRCKRANITTLVVDAKPVSGQVVFNSKLAEHLTLWRDKTYPDFDTLAAFVDEGHKAGMEVAASFNVMAEGHKYFKVGLAYQKPDWQSITYIVDRNLIAQDGSRLPVRGEGEPDDPNKTLVRPETFVQMPTDAPAKQLAVQIDSDSRVAGIIDPALLGEEPLTTPEDGRMLVLSNGSMDWATNHLRAGDHTSFSAQGKRIPVTEADSEKVAAFVNPLQPDARRYEMSLMREVAQNYAVDYIVFDRLRYANIYNDYSDVTRSAFEKWLGRPVKRWPEDIIQFAPLPGEPMKRGKLFKPWLEFRARVMREFINEATSTIKAVKPSVRFGAYVGSWFTEYYGVGVNWGSEKFPVKTGWASPDYNEAGFAEFLDWLSTGCYYAVATRDQARAQGKEDGGTVEAAAELSSAVVANSVPVYAGIYLLNYQNHPDDFSRAVQAAARYSQGVMIFDLSYLYDYNWWPILEQAFAKPTTPPHSDAALTAQLRSVEDAIRNASDSRGSGARLPAVPWQAGGG